jgi:Mg2+ and Co2+ transporter CorA
MRFLPLFLMLLATPAFAQQQPQVTPSQLAISITNAVNQMATALEQLQKEIADLKKQLESKHHEDQGK